MNLFEAKLNTNCRVVSIDLKNETLKIRLMELGLVEDCVIKVVKKSIFKHTLLVVFDASCFTLKDDVAKSIQVVYA